MGVEQPGLFGESPVVVKAQKKAAARARDLLFEMLCEMCGYDVDQLTDIQRGRLNKACKELRGVNATPEAVKSAAKKYAHVWPNVALTPTALVANWAEFAPAAAVVSVTCEVCYRKVTPGVPIKCGLEGCEHGET